MATVLFEQVTTLVHPARELFDSAIMEVMTKGPQGWSQPIAAPSTNGNPSCYALAYGRTADPLLIERG